MTSIPGIRLADGDDASPIQAIYAPFVRDTAISFEFEPPSVAEMRRRIEDTLPQFPWLVCEDQGGLAGYVYASSHSPRIAYQWSVNVTVYISPQRHRLGIGKALYASLFAILRLQGFYNVYAGVTLPNPASVGLHESLGFQPVGIYEQVGYKQGAWHDVGWWQMALQKRPPDPETPLSLVEVRECPEWQAALNTGLTLLKSVPA